MVPKEQSVLPGTEAKFQVKATGYRPKFQWKKDHEELHDGVKHCGTDTDTLRIKDVEKSDKGLYQCLVKNGDGETSNEAKLTVSKWVLKILIYSNITLSFLKLQSLLNQFTIHPQSRHSTVLHPAPIPWKPLHVR